MKRARMILGPHHASGEDPPVLQSHRVPGLWFEDKLEKRIEAVRSALQGKVDCSMPGSCRKIRVFGKDMPNKHFGGDRQITPRSLRGQ